MHRFRSAKIFRLTSQPDSLLLKHYRVHNEQFTVIEMAPAATLPKDVTDYTRMSKKDLYFAFCLVTSLFFLWGFSYGLLDVLNQHFLTIFGLTKTQTTLLQFAYFIGERPSPATPSLLTLVLPLAPRSPISWHQADFTHSCVS